MPRSYNRSIVVAGHQANWLDVLEGIPLGLVVLVIAAHADTSENTARLDKEPQDDVFEQVHAE